MRSTAVLARCIGIGHVLYLGYRPTHPTSAGRPRQRKRGSNLAVLTPCQRGSSWQAEPILQEREATPAQRRTVRPVATELQLGTRIRSLRQARRLTLRDVAER